MKGCVYIWQSGIRGMQADGLILDDIHPHVAADGSCRGIIYNWWFDRSKIEMCNESDCKCPKPEPEPNEFADRKLAKSRPFGVLTQTVKVWKGSYAAERRYLNNGMVTFASYKDALAHAKAKSAEFPEVAFLIVTLSDVLATVPPPARLTHTKVKARR